MFKTLIEIHTQDKNHLPSAGIKLCAFLFKQVNIRVSNLFKQGQFPSFFDIL